MAHSDFFYDRVVLRLAVSNHILVFIRNLLFLYHNEILEEHFIAKPIQATEPSRSFYRKGDGKLPT